MKKIVQLKTILLILINLRLIAFSSELNQLMNNFSLDDSDFNSHVINLADTGLDQNTTPSRSSRILAPSPIIIKNFFDGYIAGYTKSTIFLQYATTNIFHTPFTSFKFVINQYTADS